MTPLRTLLASLVGLLTACSAVAGDAREELLAVYATRPQGYPTGAALAKPDTSVPFRCHFYHDEAVRGTRTREAVARVARRGPVQRVP